ILANEQLVDSRWVSQEEVEGQNLLTIKPGFQAVSIQVEASKQVSGFVTVNNHVNVYVTIDKAGGPVTQLLLADVKVLAVGATAQGTTAAQPPGRNGNLSTLTLEVRDQQVDKLVFAADNGRLYLTLVPPTGGPTPQGAPTGIGNLFN
ncbi:MAG TPA: Flp pilus assembly protein CpaB, partial [Actinomycetota bacterium]|nr:Flp pilus assembly protein CpaB [Actinomycetota bacterium]